MAGQTGMTDAYEWRGRDVVDSDGDQLGKLDEIYLDQETGQPECALVNGGGLFGSKSNFVPLQGASPSGEKVKLNYTEQQIKDALGVEADGELSMAVSDTLSLPESPDLGPSDVALYPPFLCDWSAAPGFASVGVTGELDRGTTPQLERTLVRAQRHSGLVVLDLRGVVFMDASGVHAIFDAHERAQLTHGRLAVVRGPARIDRLLELTGVCDVLELVSLDPAEPPVQALLILAGVGPSPGETAPRREDRSGHRSRLRSTWCPSSANSRRTA